MQLKLSLIAPRKHFFALITCLAFVGCANTAHYTSEKLKQRGTGQHQILLMPSDIELSVLNAGGMTEPHAEWTAKAEKYVTSSIKNYLRKNKAQLIESKFKLGDLSLNQDAVQLVKLHEVVGKSILLHKYFPGMQLPNKGEKFEWTLGPSVKILRDRYKADYALFVFMRDSYVSAGRVAVMVVAAAFGVGIHGGQQVGLASLVDLTSGQVVWFNLLARGRGDLRDSDPANETVETLLNSFPK